MQFFGRSTSAVSRLLILSLMIGSLLALTNPAYAGKKGGSGGCKYSCDSKWGDDDEDEVEPVDPTGIIHTIFIVGDGFFPELVHANPGDEIKFYNLRNSSIKVEATDESWTSSTIYKNNSWSFIAQEGMELNYQKESYYSTSMKGEITLDSRPAAVEYGDLIDPYGNMIGKDGTAEGVAEGLGYTLAGVSGLVQDTGDGVGDLLGAATGSNGNGLGLGLTEAYGNGNNDDDDDDDDDDD